MEPSAISGLSAEGSALDAEPSTMRGVFLEGSDLDAEPSMMRHVFVEGSVLENGTVREIESQRGRFNSWIPNHP